MSSPSKDTAIMSWMEYIDFLHIPLKKIELATNNFADENLLTQGVSFKVYKGQLLESGNLIDIVARKSMQRSIVANEVSITKNIHHKNILSIYKITYMKDGMLIINKEEANGSLEKHLSDPTTLTWMRRLHICVGVAHALKYLHYDIEENHYVIHGNIKSSKILLDHEWEPKLHGFGFAGRAKKHHLHLTHKYNGSLQYMDPSYENTIGLTHKSDVFSFGVLLFEVLFGKEAFIENNDNWYFARLARSHYEDSKLGDLINPDLQKQMSNQSFNIFAETAYYCLKELRTQRPDMNQVLSKLEKALELQQKHELPITPAAAFNGTSLSNHLKVKSLDHLKFRLCDLELATNKFSKTYCIGSGAYGNVYKAELDHCGGIHSSAIDAKNKGKLPKKYTVAIKHILSREDKQGKEGFLAEIEMLSNCKHPNIVSFQGFCYEKEEMFLVYEYVSNGSLADYLMKTDNMTNFTWAQRLQICLNIAHGLNYLHTCSDGKQSIIHRDIKSANILLDDKWVAKIGDFGLSKLHLANQQGSTLYTNNIAGTEVYIDPEYVSTGKLKTKSDVYSFGVVLFEIMCGKLAYDRTYGQKGLPSVVRQCVKDNKTLNKLVDPKIMESDENISMLIGGINQDSLDIFTKVAYQCLAKTQSMRPTIEFVIKELDKALNFQQTSKNNLLISLKGIKVGTQNFGDCNCIEEGRFWKLYKGEVTHDGRCTKIVAKQWNRMSHQRNIQFFTEFDILFEYKHENLIALVGYCDEMEEKIIVYEHASNGSLGKHLDNHCLTWTKRLKISIDIAKGLEFLHKGGVGEEDGMIHRDIKSGSILLDGDWVAKISNFELSCKTGVYERAEHVDDNACNSLGYVDPEYQDNGYLTQVSDIYSLGVILFELLCGRSAWAKGCKDHSQSLGSLVVSHYKRNRNLDDMIFKGIKEKVAPQSLTTFMRIAFQCLERLGNDRPKAHKVVTELEKAMKFQLFSIGSNGERNEMISARMFSYKSRTARKWLCVHESRFQKVVEMFDISKLKIRIKVTTQFLTPGVNYGAYIIFKFCDSRKISSKPMYVNLKYKKGREKLQAYYATRRDNNWMNIELCQFLSHKKDTNFDVLLESLSRYHCGNSSIYVEGIEFRVINTVKNEEINQVQQILKSNSNMDQLLSLNEVNRKKHLVFSAMEDLYDSSNVKCFQLQPSTESRFQRVIELPSHHLFRINFKIQSQMLSQDTEYTCYLVFKLSRKCVGLHCPVIVRDLVRENNNEAKIIYFRSPRPWNIHENISIPIQREDEWMEVKVWKFNSNHQLKNDCIPVNLKFITYEGTMSGLIVCGLEFRPI
ncbi:putative protein kinase RLK-Pelle-L-LEC family [Helianthus debilis subsp. tardiflorus]